MGLLRPPSSGGSAGGAVRRARIPALWTAGERAALDLRREAGRGQLRQF